jgi:hypothetical protein
MRFCVTRTSSRISDDKKPCAEAVRIDGLRVDERTVKHPDDNKYIGSERWYSEGVNHRVERGHIKRDFPTSAWAVEIDGLAELMEFAGRNGEIIVSHGDESHFKGLPKIEIYDDYRE